MPLTNVTRPDEVRPSLAVEDVLAAAPAQELQRFSVPRILVPAPDDYGDEGAGVVRED
jgi:Asp-tRNA(Asn)/Glu-tRNA(Gln) amidotransferase C subunit